MPPEARRVAPVTGLTLVQLGTDSVRLEFDLPPDAREIEVLRGCGDEALAPLISLQSGDLDSVDGASRHRVRLTAQPGSPCRYGLRVRDRRYGRSDLAETPAVVWAPPPPCPVRPRVEVFPDHLLLAWDAPEVVPSEIRGYLVNGRHLVTEREFRVKDFVFGEPVSFVVDAVAPGDAPLVLSSGCTELTVIPADTFPPAAPEGLRAIRIPGGVQLLWTASPEPDLQGYRVYRLGAPGERVAVSPVVPSTQFIDREVAADRAVGYEVTAVDRQGNESPPSAAVTAEADLR